MDNCNREQIKITHNGKTIIGMSCQTTPVIAFYDFYQKMDHDIVVAKVNGKLHSLKRPITKDCALEFFRFDEPEGQQAIWNSTLLIASMACQKIFGCVPAAYGITDNGFYFDIDHSESITEKKMKEIQEKMLEIVKSRKPFEICHVSEDYLLNYFKDNTYRLHQINKLNDKSELFIYQCDDMTDFIEGSANLSINGSNLNEIPQEIVLKHTGQIKAVELYQVSSSFWLGNSNNKVLTRIHGISFLNQKNMDSWKKMKEDAMKRDHRLIGKQQKLFMFHDYSPGSCFFLPHGTIIYNNLVDFIKKQYRERGFSEVITPNLYNIELWKKSGHWEHYQENMFPINNNDKETFALKPMNCPGHCLIFSGTSRHYKELPLRFADFGVLHRNELKGALTGLTRVRKFCQDDAHIFCTENQIGEEIDGCIDFLKNVYQIFGFEFELALSTRPKKYTGSLDLWNRAETQLAIALERSGYKWKFKLEDGAFYGPKIDIMIKDAMQRSHQCATIQLDFNLPEKFNLIYLSPEGLEKRPVMIHRAILGSVERMIAVLTEHYAGDWPFWLSPRQICIVPVSSVFNEYANEIYKQYHQAGFHIEIDNSDDVLIKKIARAQSEKFNFIFIIGEKEKETNGVNIRNRKRQILGIHSHSDVLERLTYLKETYSTDDKI